MAVEGEEIDVDEVSEKDDEEREDERGKKKGRGRPRKKVDSGKQEAERMKKYLEKGKATAFVVEFGEGGKLVHSPVKGGDGAVGKKESSSTEGAKETEERIQGKAATGAGDAAEESETETAEGGRGKGGGADKATTGTTAVEDDNEREKESTTRWEAWCGWMRERMEALECKIARCSEEKKKLVEEVGELRAAGEIDRMSIRRIGKEVCDLKIKTKKSEERIKELEEALERERCAKRGGSETSSESSGRGRRRRGTSSDGSEGGEGEGGSMCAGSRERRIEPSGEEDSRAERRENEGERKRNESVCASEGVAIRNYVNCVPDPMGEREYEWEIAERRSRKKNVFIRGLRTTGRGLKEEVKKVVEKFIGLKIYIREVRPIGGGLVVVLESLEK